MEKYGWYYSQLEQKRKTEALAALIVAVIYGTLKFAFYLSIIVIAIKAW